MTNSRSSALFSGIRGTAARVVAGLLGVFILASRLAALRHGGQDANLWWVDLRALPEVVTSGAFLLAGTLLAAHAFAPARGARRRLTGVVLLLLVAVAARDTVRVSMLFAAGAVHSTVPVPLSLAIGALFGWLFVEVRRPASPPPRFGPRLLTIGAVGSFLLFGFPLAQMVAFGNTDYRRPADAVVVFGAGVRPDGTPSDALRDRVTAAAALIREGCAPRLVLSGGPGPGGRHEVDAMRQLALDCGVPRDAIREDRGGVSTGATVANTDRLLAEEGLARVLCVSHFYHLPRIKMSYRQRGREVWTVPAPQRRRLAALPWYMARESVAFWAYWCRSLA